MDERKIPGKQELFASFVALLAAEPDEVTRQ
jgi:hypothetical protein